MSITERSIRTSHADIHVRESSGKGYPLLLLHGSGASSAVFQRQLEGPLGDTWHLIALDLPGHGRSSNAQDPQHEYTITGLARTIGEVLDRLALDDVAALGWSLGGHIAIEVMATRSEISGLMLCGTPPLGRGPLAAWRAFRPSFDLLLGSKVHYTEGDSQRLLRLCYGNAADPSFLQDIRRADGVLRNVVTRSMMRGEGVDQKETVERTAVTTAMVNGADEPLARLGYIQNLDYRSLWEGHCHIIRGAGHSAFWQAPEQFNVLLHRFMVAIELGSRRENNVPIAGATHRPPVAAVGRTRATGAA